MEVADGLSCEMRDLSDRQPKEEEREREGEEEEEEIIDEFESPFNLPMREISYRKIRFNPVTSGLAVSILVIMVIYCGVDPISALDQMTEAKQWCSLTFTWFYIGAPMGWGVFLCFVYFRFGHIKLGKPDDVPSFSSHAYFTMLFCAGIGSGMFYYGIAEPLMHRESSRYSTAKSLTEDQLDLYSINLTIFHWGIGGWIVYIMTAITCSLAAYCFDLPMTMRSCFYFLLGPYTWGWIGDIIDAMSIITVISGVCTSLGIGASQLVYGLEHLGVVESRGGRTNDIISIWFVTLTATVSVLSGLHKGIKYLSQTAFLGGISIWLVVIKMDDTVFLLNLIVEEVGFYFQHFLRLHFQTDAFSQLPEGSGRSTDGLSPDRLWFDDWTVFYWAWWSAWAVFVGLFIARISRGRTIAFVFRYALIGPLIYAIFWTCIFGGAAIRSERRAIEVQQLGLLLYQNETYYQRLDPAECYNAPDLTVYVYTETDIVAFDESGYHTIDWENTTLFYRNREPNVTPVCLFNTIDSSWFNLMDQYGEVSLLLTMWSLVCIYIYFVTSSDSGSLVVDHLASNGSEKHHPVQRIFWSFMEGGLATALVYAGGEQSLAALQAASVVSALPYTFMLSLMAISLWRMCLVADGMGGGIPVAIVEERNISKMRDTFRERESFEQKEEEGAERNEIGPVPVDKVFPSFIVPVYGGVLNVVEFVFSGFGYFAHPIREKTMPFPSTSILILFFRSLVVPSYSLFEIISLLHPNQKWKNIGQGALVTVLFYLGMLLLFLSLFIDSPGLSAFGLLFYLFFSLCLTLVRTECRGVCVLYGTVVEDFLACLLLYPQVLVQMIVELNSQTRKRNEDQEQDLPEVV